MVKKKITNNIDDMEEKSNDVPSNLNLNHNNEYFKEEALLLYDAIMEGKIDLDTQEKNKLLQELDLILNYFDSNESDEECIDPDIISENWRNIFNSNFKGDNPISHDLSSENNLNSQDEVSDSIDGKLDNDSSNIIVENNFDDESDKLTDNNLFNDDFVGDDVSEDLSVDDALNDLIVVQSSSMADNDQNVETFSDNSDSVDVVSDESFDKADTDDFSNVLSVDDALNDLMVNYSNDIAIKVENVTMQFKVSKDKIDTFKEFAIRTIKRNKSSSKIITALKDVSFEIPKGDRVGIIGFNGAGKSTLLKVLAGVYDATEGTIETKGKIAPLLELGAGFDMNYTGKDNIFLNGAFLGYSEDFLKEKYDEILEFSELGDAINYHVKTYSSGMRAKLGFSIATIVEPDILIIDEILSVGDIKFRKKSSDKIKSLINSGITVLLVSHSVGQIRDLCNKAIWIDEGKLKMYGEVNEVCDAYVKAASNATKDQLQNIKLN